jgi:hypothetical protein
MVPDMMRKEKFSQMLRNKKAVCGKFRRKAELNRLVVHTITSYPEVVVSSQQCRQHGRCVNDDSVVVVVNIRRLDSLKSCGRPLEMSLFWYLVVEFREVWRSGGV